MRGHTVFWELVLLSMKAGSLKEHLSIGLFSKKYTKKDLLKIFAVVITSFLKYVYSFETKKNC